MSLNMSEHGWILPNVVNIPENVRINWYEARLSVCEEGGEEL